MVLPRFLRLPRYLFDTIIHLSHPNGPKGGGWVAPNCSSWRLRKSAIILICYSAWLALDWYCLESWHQNRFFFFCLQRAGSQCHQNPCTLFYQRSTTRCGLPLNHAYRPKLGVKSVMSVSCASLPSIQNNLGEYDSLGLWMTRLHDDAGIEIHSIKQAYPVLWGPLIRTLTSSPIPLVSPEYSLLVLCWLSLNVIYTCVNLCLRRIYYACMVFIKGREDIDGIWCISQQGQQISSMLVHHWPLRGWLRKELGG